MEQYQVIVEALHRYIGGNRWRREGFINVQSSDVIFQLIRDGHITASDLEEWGSHQYALGQQNVEEGYNY